MPVASLQQLPEEVQDLIFTEAAVDANIAIAADFKLTLKQLQAVLTVLAAVFTGNTVPVDLPAALAKLPLAGIDVRALALALAERRLWPLHHYLPGVDSLIERLGGKVPAEVAAPASAALSGQNQQLTARDFLDQKSEHRYALLTHRPLLDAAGQAVDPTIENWLKDFLRLMGPVMNDGLARSQYLVRSLNVRKLSNEETENLLNFLICYGDGTAARFHLEGTELTVKPLAAENTPDRPKQPTQAVVDIAEIASTYRDYVQNLQTIIANKAAGIEVEIAGQSRRLADILWNGLGLEDKDRIITALVLLAQKKMLVEVIASDLRINGIVRRSIGVRFGEQAKHRWQPDGSLASVILFLQLVLQEKLHFSSVQTAMIGQYISQLAGLDSAAYIDMMRGEFRLREVIFSGSAFIVEGK
ncbi:MAG: hypothetical protein V1846_01625 [Candidatus Komeilibacteria bacterium]